jgi:hypothetical protein
VATACCRRANAHLFDLVGLELRQHGVALDLLHDAGINVVLVKLPAGAKYNTHSSQQVSAARI